MLYMHSWIPQLERICENCIQHNQASLSAIMLENWWFFLTASVNNLNIIMSKSNFWESEKEKQIIQSVGKGLHWTDMFLHNTYTIKSVSLFIPKSRLLAAFL